jgi:DNA-binding transcriptional MerR regulator
MSANARWTLDELTALVAKALAVGYDGPVDGRARDVPERRSVRYYTTLGLLDRPVELRGRTAYYGPKHLLQLVAIKRLQAQGRSLAEIQQHLLGLDEGDLKPLAKLPAKLEALLGEPEKQASAEREDFWRETPADVVASEAPVVWQALTLADGVVLMLEASRPLREDDQAALQEVAVALVRLLESRGLVKSES